jgi:hypothetical protein
MAMMKTIPLPQQLEKLSDSNEGLKLLRISTQKS